MIANDPHQKVTARHLKRNAYLYIRQSTLRQVFENTESTDRQYALRQRAVALGWPQEQIIVIDCDQGQSGASTAGRDGFQRLVADVGMARAGIVMGLEVSRLARNSSDWHRLLEICALSDTLILDEDGVYDPAYFNDRLLLGLKGTMSEAELHVLRARLRGGIINKARRGELEVPLPIGFRYDQNTRVILDPDKQVQQTIRLFFETYRRTGSATATVKAFREQGLKFPRRARTGPAKGEIIWAELEHSRTLWILHNPRFAGAFFFGRSRQRKGGGAGGFIRLPREEWTALTPDAHPGYISWEEFEENQRRLRENAQALGLDRKKSPPREGPALVQGLIICGVCGDRMTVRYNSRNGARLPTYACQRRGIARGEPICQSIPGQNIDNAVSKLLLEAVNPMALEVTLTVQQELQTRADQADKIRAQHVERARYEADLARRRFMQVDPENRLVADELEAEWNKKLRALSEAQKEYEHRREQAQALLSEEQRARVLALATDLPKLWHEPTTPDRERKRMVRLLIEDITLRKTKTTVTAQVRFRAGATTTLTLPPALSAWQLRQTNPEVVTLIDELLDKHTDKEIAAILNQRGFQTGTGKRFSFWTVWRLRTAYRLRSLHTRLRARGMLDQSELARRLGVKPLTVRIWRSAGLLRAHVYNEKGQYLYEPTAADAPVRKKHKGITEQKRQRRLAIHKPTTDVTDEVQCEA
jgi:DNA invertase Pin-like site-specific DNA recombinase